MLTPKQEKFCHKYIETGNASEAYRQAYNAENMPPESIHVKANEVKSNVKVASRIKELQEEHKQRHMFTVDDAINEYNEARELAKQEKQTSSMISATKSKCELLGLEAPKKHTVETTITQILQECQNRTSGLPKDDK